MKNIAYVLLGSNLGDSVSLCGKACLLIAEKIGSIEKKSNIYTSEAWGFKTSSIFYNQVVEIATDLSPQELLEKLLSIEVNLGRTRSGEKGYQSRSMDLDILFYNDAIIAEPNLNIPHPLLHKRRFTLVPLGEVNPNLKHPIFQKEISNLIEICDDPIACTPFL